MSKATQTQIDVSKTNMTVVSVLPFKEDIVTILRISNNCIYSIFITYVDRISVKVDSLLNLTLNDNSLMLKPEKEGKTLTNKKYIIYSFNTMMKNPLVENILIWQEVHITLKNNTWVNQTVNISCIKTPISGFVENIPKEIISDFSYHTKFTSTEFATLIRNSMKTNRALSLTI